MDVCGYVMGGPKVETTSNLLVACGLRFLELFCLDVCIPNSRIVSNELADLVAFGKRRWEI